MVAVLFQLVFAGIGIGLVVYAYQLVRPTGDTQQVYLMAGLGLFFFAFGLFGLWKTWQGRAAAQHRAALREKYADTPWKVRPEWRTSTLAETSDASWTMKLFVLIYNAAAWPGAAYLIYRETVTPPADWDVLMILAFPIAGLGGGWFAFRDALRRRKFGRTTLQMDALPGWLGRRIAMRMRTGMTPADAPSDGFHVQLSCYRRYIVYRTDGDGDRSRQVRRDLLWRDEKHVQGRSYGMEQKLELPISFMLPDEAPPSTPEKTPERIMWEVEATAEQDGLDFNAAFEIPVFAPDSASDTSPSNDASAGAARSSSGQDGAAPAVSAADNDADPVSDPVSDPYALYEVRDTFTEPVSKGITLERPAGGRLVLDFAPGRNLGTAILLGLLAVACLAGGVLLFFVSFFASLILLVIGGAFGYVVWTQYLTRTTLIVKAGQVKVRRRAPSGKETVTAVPCDELADVVVSAAGRSSNKTHYELALYRLAPDRQQAVFNDAEMPTSVRTFLDALGAPSSKEVLRQARTRIQERGVKVRVVGGLTNKPEADWLAAQIVEAAHAEAQFAAAPPSAAASNATKGRKMSAG